MNAHYRFSLMAICILLTCALTVGVASADLVTYHAQLDGASTIPPSGSSATGTAVFTIDTELTMATGLFSIHVEFSGLSSEQTSTQIYAGTTTSNGTLIDTLAPGSPLDTILVFNHTQEMTFGNALYSDQVYVNINTVDHPDGEIRGNFTLYSTVDNDPTSWGAVKALFR